VFTRADIETTVLKAPGTLYSSTEDGKITNIYNIELVNKTFRNIPVTLKIESPAEAILQKVGDPAVVVPAEGIFKGIFIVKMPREALSESKTKIVFGIFEQDKKIETVKARFIGPIKFNKSE
jgi:hypothetical protein